MSQQPRQAVSPRTAQAGAHQSVATGFEQLAIAPVPLDHTSIIEGAKTAPALKGFLALSAHAKTAFAARTTTAIVYLSASSTSRPSLLSRSDVHGGRRFSKTGKPRPSAKSRVWAPSNRLSRLSD